MLTKVSEKSMHGVRCGLTCGWLLLIASLFYDPISAWLTEPNNIISPLRLKTETCIQVQGVCLKQSPYPLGASIFWGIVIPVGIFVLFVFGHEFWRRICPLSFLSQIPRALGKQRRIAKVDATTGQVRYELAKIKPDSWLGRNYLYFQFGLLYLGVCGRILFFDSHRFVLGLFLLGTIVSAILVGYLYAGKTWCHYFCPMGPVQLFYGEPRGLLTSIAHESERTMVTQSMCRRITPEGLEESACVACNSPCVDIDAERSYWDGLKRADYKFLYYGYLGLVIGFFSYYYLYSGSWAYWFSGAWARQENQLETLLSPGFYLLDTTINIPKLVAVPLTIGLSIALCYFGGKQLEKSYKSYQLPKNPALTSLQVQHQLFTLFTFITFNFFFIFAGRSYLTKLPLSVQYLFDVLLVVVSSLWLYRTWKRSQELYTKESLASRLRKQLSKLQLDVSRFVEGRSLDSLNADEVYVLAKILPGFTGEKRIQAYKGVLKDSLEEGYVNSASSLEVLQQMRQELGISEQEHLQAITELGIEDPDLFNPNQQRSRENQLRLQSFRQRIRGLVSNKRRRGATGLGRDLLKVVKKEKSINEVLQKDGNTFKALSCEYGLTSEEESRILADLDPEAYLHRRGEILLSQLQQLAQSYLALEAQKSQLSPKIHLITALGLLQATIRQKQGLFTKGVLEILENLGQSPEATRIALALASLAPKVVLDLLHDQQHKWEERLTPTLISRLGYQCLYVQALPTDELATDISSYLEGFLSESDSLTKAIALYLLSYFNPSRSQQQARQFLESHLMLNPLVKETAQAILDDKPKNLITLEKLLYLSSIELFNPLKTENLLELAYQTQDKNYQPSEVIIQQGNQGQKLLLLVQGQVQSKMKAENGDIQNETLTPVQMLNELAILAQIPQLATLVATEANTQILSLDGNLFEDLFSHNREFARRLLEQESRRLQLISHNS